MSKKSETTRMTTLKQYAFIRSYIEEHGYAPALSEMQEYMGYKSKSTAEYHFKKLFRAGFLETDIEDVVVYPRAYRLAKNPLGER